MKRSALVLIAASLLLCAQARAQTLIYSVSYGETRASFHARFPNGALGASVQDKLAMVRASRKTEIYSISMIDGKRSLLFSDEGMNLEILPAPINAGYPLLGSTRAYVTAVEREWRGAPTPGVFAGPPALYEIRLDGSKQFRRLFEAKPNQSAAFLSPAGLKAMFESFADGKYTVLIYDVPTWKLLHSWDLTKITEAHCPDCLPLSCDWLADGNHLFFNLDLGDDDSIDPRHHNVPGTYTVAEDGTDLGAIPPKASEFRLPGSTQPNYVPASLIGQLPNGQYVFRNYAQTPGRPTKVELFLVISGADSTSKKQIPLQKLGLRQFYLSRSGKYLAYIEDRQIANYRTERHLWGKDLQSGEEKELLFVPPPNPPTSLEPNVSLTVLGWANN